MSESSVTIEVFNSSMDTVRSYGNEINDLAGRVDQALKQLSTEGMQGSSASSVSALGDALRKIGVKTQESAEGLRAAGNQFADSYSQNDNVFSNRIMG